MGRVLSEWLTCVPFESLLGVMIFSSDAPGRILRVTEKARKDVRADVLDG